MAFSTNTFTYTGGAQTFTLSLSLGYLEESDITAFVVGDLDGEGAQIFRDFTFDSEFVIRLTDPLTIGDEVTAERTVDKASFTVDFETGGDVTARNLMILYKQVFMAQQELLDGRVGAFNPVGDSENAQAAAAEALISELAAKVSEDLAELDRIATAADRVVTTADAVNTSADAIQTAADRVVTTADAIATSADEAGTSADAITTNADASATASDRVQTGLDRAATEAAAIIAVANQPFASMQALLAVDHTNLPDETAVELVSYHPIATSRGIAGGGRFVWDASRAKSEHDGGIYISPTVPWTWADNGVDFIAGVGDTDGGGNGVFVRVTNDDLRVEHYGARTGTTVDSTASVKAAFDRMLADPTDFSGLGGNDNRYGISGPLVTQSGFAVFGKTIHNIGLIALASFTGDHFFKFSGNAAVSTVTDLHFQNCYMVGGPTSGVAYVKKLIDLDNASGVWVTACELKFFTEHAVLSRGVQPATELFIHDCRISGNVISNTTCVGIEIAGNDSAVERNLIRSCKTHMHFLGRGNVFIGNHIYNSDADRDTYGLVYDDAKTLIINNNYFDNVRIRLSDAKGITMTGNKFLLQNGTEWTGVKAFVVFKATAAAQILENCTMMGNVFKQTSGTALDAFDVDESEFVFDYANMREMFIKDNTFTGFAVQTTHPTTIIAYTGQSSRTANLAVRNPFGTNSVYKRVRHATWMDATTNSGIVKRTAVSGNVLTVVLSSVGTGDIVAEVTVNVDGY